MIGSIRWRGIPSALDVSVINGFSRCYRADNRAAISIHLSVGEGHLYRCTICGPYNRDSESADNSAIGVTDAGFTGCGSTGVDCRARSADEAHRRGADATTSDRSGFKRAIRTRIARE